MDGWVDGWMDVVEKKEKEGRKKGYGWMVDGIITLTARERARWRAKPRSSTPPLYGLSHSAPCLSLFSSSFSGLSLLCFKVKRVHTNRRRHLFI